MSAITPHYRTVQQLLQSQSFAIDEYQREYKWEKKNVDELLSDLLAKFETSHREGDSTAAVSNYEVDPIGWTGIGVTYRESPTGFQCPSRSEGVVHVVV